MNIARFIPPHRTLMGPGPSDVSPRVLQALAQPTIGHLDPYFIGMMDEIKTLLQYAFQTKNPFTIAISAPGSAGMEACFVNLIEPGETVIVCRNGVFGDRMRENVERSGGLCIMVDDEWGAPVSPEKLEQALKDNPQASIVAFVHAETSTGVLSDAKTLAELAQKYNCLSIVDAVTSLGGVPLLVDEWGLDAVYSGSQKCLSCVPGLSPVTFSSRALEKMQNRTSKVQSWFLDQSLILGYWSGETQRSYHHTAPVNSLYALHESLLLLKEEGIERVWQRHRDMHFLLKNKLEAIGIKFLVDASCRLPQLNAVAVPEGLHDQDVRKALLREYNLEIGAGLGALAGKAWRIGLMGYSARKENVLLCASALNEVCLVPFRKKGE